MESPEDIEKEHSVSEASTSTSSWSSSDCSDSISDHDMLPLKSKEAMFAADQSVFPPVFCTRKGGRSHLQESFVEQGVPIPFCRDRPFKNAVIFDESQIGQSIRYSQLCRRCISRAPQHVRTAVRVVSSLEMEAGQGSDD